MDPAKPLFISAKNNRKLSKDDAEFVDIIHTDVLERGILATAGHADFYVNGGIEQPGCRSQNDMRMLQWYIMGKIIEIVFLFVKRLEVAIISEHQNTLQSQ